MENSPSMGQPQRLSFNTNMSSLIQCLLVFPLRCCGRQWVWIRRGNDISIYQVAINVFSVPFLACATLLSGVPAAIGVLFFSARSIPRVTEDHPRGDITLLAKETSDDKIAERIRDHFRNAGYEYLVEVRSIEGDLHHNTLHRYITLINPASTPITRLWEGLKHHFYNEMDLSLNSLHHSIIKNDNLDRLKSILALYRAVTFSLSVDLGYIHTRLGEWT